MARPTLPAQLDSLPAPLDDRVPLPVWRDSPPAPSAFAATRVAPEPALAPVTRPVELGPSAPRTRPMDLPRPASHANYTKRAPSPRSRVAPSDEDTRATLQSLSDFSRLDALEAAPTRHSSEFDLLLNLDLPSGDTLPGPASPAIQASTAPPTTVDLLLDLDAPADPLPPAAAPAYDPQAYTRQLIDGLRDSLREHSARPLDRDIASAATTVPALPDTPHSLTRDLHLAEASAPAVAPVHHVEHVQHIQQTQPAPSGQHGQLPAAPAAGPAAPKPRWPALREDLQLHHGPALPDGEPSWTLQDPVRHRFLRIDWLSHEVLRRWWLGDAELIADQINHQTTLAIEADHVLQVLAWAVKEELVQPFAPPAAAVAARQAADEAGLSRLARWLLHHYLFFRVPLVDPDRMLGRLLPWLRPLGSSGFGWASVLAFLIGGFGLGREIASGAQSLQHHWLDLLSWQGLALYGATMVVVKLAHELGHALVAKHYGLRVPTMGLAFMVMAPVAYTDTSEAWRLADARARLRIAAAGVRTELTLAAWATLAWTLLPDGPARTAAFIVASMTWVSSIAINASPFMRFDGYYLLCDWLDLPNLHERSFALARWQLRRGLLGWEAPVPEHFPQRLRRGLITFAWATWAYRLTLYLGIAWMVYHFGFPALGLLLFAVELGWFIAAPLKTEVSLWIKGRGRWQAAWRWRFVALGLAGLAALAAWPWPVRESAGAVLAPADELIVKLPASVTLVALKVQAGQQVKAGEALLEAALPSLQQQRASNAVKQRQLTQQVAVAALQGEEKARWRSLQAELSAAQQEGGALATDQARLQPRAPFDARVVMIDPALRAGMVLAAGQPLMQLASPGPSRVVAYVSDYAARHLKPGDTARFGTDALPLRRYRAHVSSVSPHAAGRIDEAMLVRAQGGPIEAQEVSGSRSSSWRPQQALYRVELQLDEDPGLAPRHWRGHVVVDLPGQSPWQHAWQSAAEVLAREAGF